LSLAEDCTVMNGGIGPKYFIYVQIWKKAFCNLC